MQFAMAIHRHRRSLNNVRSKVTKRKNLLSDPKRDKMGFITNRKVTDFLVRK